MTPGRGLVALTGGTGFVGPHIVAALTAAGWHVRLLSRRPYAGAEKVEVVTGSLDDASALDRLVAGADVVVHAAGLIKALHRKDFFDVNHDGAQAVAAAVARMVHAPRLVVVSTLAAREPALSAYAASKRAGETAFSGFHNCVVLRPTAVYGPGDRETGAFFRAARAGILPVPRQPAAKVTLIHVSDVAAAVTALCSPGPRGVFELTDARTGGYGWRELAKTIAAAAADIFGRDVRIMELPAGLFRAIAGLNAIAAHVKGQAAILGPDKVRELFHQDWSSQAKHQPPPDLWRPGVELTDGLNETLLWLKSCA